MFETIDVRNVQSGALRSLRVGRYVKNSFLVHWTMDGPIELRITKEGSLMSSPRSFLKIWKLTEKSEVDLREAIANKIKQIKQMIQEERTKL